MFMRLLDVIEMGDQDNCEIIGNMTINRMTGLNDCKVIGTMD